MVGHGVIVGYGVTVGYAVNVSLIVGAGEGAALTEGMVDGAAVASLSLFLSLFLSFCALRLESDVKPRALGRLCFFVSPKTFSMSEASSTSDDETISGSKLDSRKKNAAPPRDEYEILRGRRMVVISDAPLLIIVDGAIELNLRPTDPLNFRWVCVAAIARHEVSRRICPLSPFFLSNNILHD